MKEHEPVEQLGVAQRKSHGDRSTKRDASNDDARQLELPHECGDVVASRFQSSGAPYTERPLPRKSGVIESKPIG